MKIRISIFILCYLSACQSVLDINIDKPNKLVIESYLRSGDSIQVTISESSDLDENNRKTIDDIDLYVSHLDHKVKLNYTGPSSFGSKYSSALNTFKIPKTGFVKLETEYEGTIITSEALVPQPIQFDSSSINFNRSVNGTINTSSIEIELFADFLSQEDFFLVELELHQSVLYNGQIYHPKTILFSKYARPNDNLKQLSVKDGAIPGGSGGYNSAQEEYFVLKLYTLDGFFQQFLKAIKSQERDGDGLSMIFGSNVTEIPTNIKNGYGIFTVINADTMRLELE
jgi:hypothetical protein